MYAFCISFPTLNEDHKSKLAKWAHRRLREFDFKQIGDTTRFLGLFNVEHDQKKFDAGFKRNLKNWDIPFTIYDRKFIRRISNDEYLSEKSAFM